MKSKLNRFLMSCIFALSVNTAMADVVTIQFPQNDPFAVCGQVPGCYQAGGYYPGNTANDSTVTLWFPQFTVSNVCYYFGWFC